MECIYRTNRIINFLHLEIKWVFIFVWDEGYCMGFFQIISSFCRALRDYEIAFFKKDFIKLFVHVTFKSQVNLMQYFTQFGHMAELNESEFVMQKTFKNRYFA
jgi:hypothetical protein